MIGKELEEYLYEMGFESEIFGNTDNPCIYWHYKSHLDLFQEENGRLYYYSGPEGLYDLGITVDLAGHQYIKNKDDVNKVITIFDNFK